MSIINELKEQLVEIERQIAQLEDMREEIYKRLDNEME
jgi:predicted phage-related endonuclease